MPSSKATGVRGTPVPSLVPRGLFKMLNKSCLISQLGKMKRRGVTEGRSKCHRLGMRDVGRRMEGGSPLQRAGGAQQCHRSPGAHGGVCWVGRGTLPLPHPLPLQPGAPKTDLLNGVCFKLIIRTPLALEFDNWPNDLGEFAASWSISISINQSTAGIESAFVPGLLPSPRVTFSFFCSYLIAAGQILPYPG